MHYGLLTLELHGHLNPMTTLGAELVGRGHQVTLLGSSRAKPFAERAELNWEPLVDSAEINAGWDKLGELSGLAALKHTGQMVKRNATATRDELPAIIAARQIDALLIDQFAPAGALVAEQQRLPYVVACNALAGHLHSSVPPAPMNWPCGRGPLSRLRNHLANRIVGSLFDRFAGAGGPGAVSPLMLTDLDRQWGNAMISQQPACFDFPGHPRPIHFHYTAPWHAEGRDEQIAFPWERLDGRPLVFASMGTLQNKLRHVYAAIAESARGLDVQFVLALGSPDAVLDAPVPENVIVVPYAPQLKLLDRASAVITHAGLNTTLEALARGLPMLCLPVTNDQPGIARRVEHLGAGLVLSLGRASAGRIRQALQTIMDNPRFRNRATSLRDEMSGLDGPRMAAEIIEQATGACAMSSVPMTEWDGG
ncbi:glycosyltransferase [Blastopirellula marina]|uniref:Glycosyl transferase family 1 n=1 Tax=Blastopirellula marina TaxID=124 RepID=A0A2S8GN31_9BACT|nr:glycosyltransferase [Blastopirellula marina]PQO45771.1 glycosyl transferase family 1 [Blastopirellula marina]